MTEFLEFNNNLKFAFYSFIIIGKKISTIKVKKWNFISQQTEVTFIINKF